MRVIARDEAVVMSSNLSLSFDQQAYNYKIVVDDSVNWHGARADEETIDFSIVYDGKLREVALEQVANAKESDAVSVVTAQIDPLSAVYHPQFEIDVDVSKFTFDLNAYPFVMFQIQLLPVNSCKVASVSQIVAEFDLGTAFDIIGKPLTKLLGDSTFTTVSAYINAKVVAPVTEKYKFRVTLDIPISHNAGGRIMRTFLTLLLRTTSLSYSAALAVGTDVDGESASAVSALSLLPFSSLEDLSAADPEE